jgi:PKD repeat protein
MTAGNNRFVCLAVSGTLCLASATAWALDPGQPPGGNFDLSHWKLQLPTSNNVLTCDNGSVDEKTPAQLEAGFTNAYFYTGTDGAMVFWAPINGATTSGSSYPRSELRELIDPSSSTVNWIPYGTHILNAQCKVLQVGPTNKKVIIGQIHAYSSAALPTVKMYYSDGKVYGTIKTNSTDDTSDYTFASVNVTTNKPIIYQIKVVNGLVTLTYSNSTYSYNIFQSDPNYTNETQYFKAGDYCQEYACSNPSNYGARVAFYAVNLTHAPSITNQPVSQVVTVGSNVTFTVGAAGNPPLRYFWQFNGTNMTGKTNATLYIPSVQFTNAGNYSVIITDYVGTVTSVVTSSVATLTVNPPPPSADFSATPTNGVVPLQVVFTDASTGSPTNWNWDFDNNGTTDSTAQNPTNTYASAGTYTVRLIASNSGGSSTNTKAAYITVLPLPPTANFSATPTNGVAPLNVAFTDTSTGSPTAWAWDFGDAGTSTLQSPSHNYTTAGVYTVQLIASNAGGSTTNTRPAYINVITPLQSWSDYYGVPGDSGDADGDGMSNTNEFLAGLNPTDGGVYLHIIDIAKSNSDIYIHYIGADGDDSWWPGIASRTNVLEYSPGTANGSYSNNFLSTGQTNILSGGNGTGVLTNMVDYGGATNVPSRYYRVRVLVP